MEKRISKIKAVAEGKSSEMMSMQKTLSQSAAPFISSNRVAEHSSMTEEKSLSESTLSHLVPPMMTLLLPSMPRMISNTLDENETSFLSAKSQLPDVSPALKESKHVATMSPPTAHYPADAYLVPPFGNHMQVSSPRTNHSGQQGESPKQPIPRINPSDQQDEPPIQPITDKSRLALLPVPLSTASPGLNRTTTDGKTSKFPDKTQLISPPKSAPAQLTGNSPNTKKLFTPTSAGKKSNWGFGIKSRMTKWLNPDATTADIGESMQAFYDEKRKVWVFPGEDPEEKAKPVGPPPMTMLTPTKDADKLDESNSTSYDPVAAMMAPPRRAPSSLHRHGAATHASPMPGMMMMPPIAGTSTPAFSPMGTGGLPPKFMIFKPVSESKANKGPIKEVDS